ncbi:Putative zn(2)Cys(6) fungal-type DNA-binding domain, fungal transcription factor [Colletotrichum destructivum]|uniref:Zn(2)Cys(6) fungal-type DNA-binding domain, fungal transcription factor n=1 Tax=Colletotrichum destructivum TaxID=34406 RepID=A0AAX4J392_9PEZI|nr:Putative zn(2)Cys(6) fungal-type DNA-binding domain, fungal transcription factor [Colletotrichum destructivum]
MSSGRTPPGSSGTKSRSDSPPQVRRGCSSCKARRVKCDGMRPACRRCSVTGTVCDGFLSGLKDGSPGRNPPLCPRQTSSIITPCGAHAGLVALSCSDRRHFEWFVRKTSSRLPGVFSSPVWTKFVIQAGSTEPAILYAILAIGAVHERGLEMAEPCRINDERETLKPQSSDSTERLSLQYYNKSISFLQSRLLMQDTESIRIVLIVCTIFICLEFMQKQYKTGLLHFQHSLRLLGSLQRSAELAPSSDPIDEWFAEVIPRLDIQATLLSNELYSGCGPRTPSASQPLPELFQTTRDASHHLDTLLIRAYRLKRDGSATSVAGDVTDIFELLATQQTLRNDLELWLQCFDDFKARTWSELSDGERIVCWSLPIHHTVAYIITNTSLNPENELIFDHYTHHFASIVSGSRKILEALQPSALPTPTADTSPDANPLSADCTADIGLVPPLFYAAIKCRVPRIRRQAVELLLLGERHEGLWDAVMSARLAREIMTLEERGIVDGIQDDKRASPDTVVPILPGPPRIHKLWIETPIEPKGDIILSVLRLHSNRKKEMLARRFDAANGFWTSSPLTSRVVDAAKHETSKK